MKSYNNLVKKRRENILDFKDFCEQNINLEEEKRFFKQGSHEKENLERQAKEKISEYANLSQQELMAELIKQTNQKKQDGSLSQEKIEQMYQAIYNILPPENRQNLDNIFNKLR